MSNKIEINSLYEVPANSISCFIGRICKEPGSDFANNGILIVDFTYIENESPDNEETSTQHKAIASWTLRSAYTAWKYPPKVKFKGKLKVKGNISIPNAQLNNITISGGPPLTGTVAVSTGGGTATIPVIISNASGTAKIEQSANAEIEMETDGDSLDIELISQKGAQLPWCIAQSDAQEDGEIDPEKPFIQEGDLALCMAFGNSLDNLYVVDIFKPKRDN